METTISFKAKPIGASRMIADALKRIDENYLHQIVEAISIPRHFVFEPHNNERTAHWIRSEFGKIGWKAEFQGKYQNIVATSGRRTKGPYLIAAGHYDTVPESPGADDNASSVAVLLACAKVLKQIKATRSIMMVVFNREEDLFKRSIDFVQRHLWECLQGQGYEIAEVNVLEMVGYCSHEPGSQWKPPGLPVKVRDTGDFLGIIGNSQSNAIVSSLLRSARTFMDGFPVIGLKTFMGIEKYVPVLQRSDHAPFWAAKIPALMWTDTSEYRNPHYHKHSDTPDTLDYQFMGKVARLLLARMIQHSKPS